MTSILSAVQGASNRKRINSESERAWRKLSQDERDAIREGIESGSVGTGKMSDVINAEGVKISKYFLDKVLAGEVE